MKQEQLERKRITIGWKDGHRRVRARVINAGLAIHRAPESTESWTITHIPTGTSIGMFGTEEDAMEYMEAVSELVDWSNVKIDASPLTASQRKQIKALRRGFGGW